MEKIKVNRTIHNSLLHIYIHRSLFDFWIVLFYLFNGASYKSSKKQPHWDFSVSPCHPRLLRGISTFHHLEIVGLGLETSEHPSVVPRKKKHMDSIWSHVGGLCGAITCAITSLKNMSQWVSDDIPYMKWKIKFMFQTTNQSGDFSSLMMIFLQDLLSPICVSLLTMVRIAGWTVTAVAKSSLLFLSRLG